MAKEVGYSVGDLVTVPQTRSLKAARRFQDDARTDGDEALGDLATTGRIPSGIAGPRGLQADM
jgi:hypothetical protein